LNADAQAADAVLTERRDGVLVVALNRPDARNAVNAAVAQGIADAMEELEGDGELRVGVLTGAGGTFCAGMDLKAFVRGESPYVEGRGFAGIAQQPPGKPMIAAVEGLRAGRRLRGGTRVRPHRGRRGRPLRHPRGQARPVRGRRRPDPPAQANPLPHGNGAGAHRRPGGGPSGSGARSGQPRDRTGEALSAALELAATIARNGPLALDASKRVVQG